MLDAFYITANVSNPDDGMWGFFNTRRRQFRASKDGYLITAPPNEKAWRLDVLTEGQEAAFWDFNFSKATEGLKDRSYRGYKTTERKPRECTVMVAVNDGAPAWQGVGTIHGHVIWTKAQSLPGDLRERLIADRTVIAGATSNHYRPYASCEIDLSKPDYAADIRHARKCLRDHFVDPTTPRDEIGYSLYTQCSYNHDPRKGGRLVVELWTKDHHSLTSISGMVRYWTGHRTFDYFKTQKKGLSVGDLCRKVPANPHEVIQTDALPQAAPASPA